MVQKPTVETNKTWIKILIKEVMNMTMRMKWLEVINLMIMEKKYIQLEMREAHKMQVGLKKEFNLDKFTEINTQE